MGGWKGLNRVEHVLLMKVVLVGHHHHAHKTTRTAEQKLVERYNKYIVLQGDYVEKLYVKLLTVTSIKAVTCILPLLFDSPSYVLEHINLLKAYHTKLHVQMVFPMMNT